MSWLAPSSCSGGTRLGTEASLAGIQNRLTVSMKNEAMSRYTSEVPLLATEPTSGIDRNRVKRRTSQTTIVRRRSHRSAKAPASGPNSTAGSSRKTRTPPVAYAFPWKDSTSCVASAVVARKPSQSPKLLRTSAEYSLRKLSLRRAARGPRPTGGLVGPGALTIPSVRRGGPRA